MMKPGGSGWNDPPLLSHQVHSETKSRRNLLNKRVAYLGHSPQNDDNQVFSSSLPPPTDAAVFNKISSNQLKEASPPLNIFIPNVNISNQLDDKDKNDPKLNNELKVDEDADNSKQISDIVAELHSLVQLCSNDKNKITITDIEKKIEIFQEMIQNKTLSTPVLTGMNRLTLHLLNQEYEKAWNIHVSLMCDHVSEVRSWMVGVKRLINELKKFSAPKQ